MKREIKFRGISSFSNKWLYGNYIMIDDQPAIASGSIEHIDGSELRSGSWDFVIPETIGQYTGVKDKNGKDIYEGDIIKSPLNNIVEVQFGYNEIVAKNANIKTLDSYACYGWIVKNVRNGIIEFLDNTFLEGEVIGNIYDDMELLKQEQICNKK